MGRVSLALLLAVSLMPAHSAAQSNSLPSTAFGPSYDRVQGFSRQVVPGWYAVTSDVNDPSPVTSRYMARGDIDPVPSYARGRAPVVVPRSAYPDYLDRTMTRINYRPMLVPVYYSRAVYTRHHQPLVLGYVEPVVQSPPAVYVIPGCYLGDAPPMRPEKLSPGCKMENLKRVYH